MKLQDCVDLLEKQHDILRRKNACGEYLRPTDLPRIDTTLILSKEDKRAIYESQEGIEFHGMSSERLSTILSDFDGSTVWVPHSCKELMSFDEFEKRLFNAYGCSSSGYDSLLVLRSPNDRQYTDGGVLERKEAMRTYSSFPWSSMFIGPYEHLYTNVNIETAKRMAEASLIKPQLAIVNAALPKKSTVTNHESKEQVINKLWCYLAWAKRLEP